jgi:hypothetical protein
VARITDQVATLRTTPQPPRVLDLLTGSLARLRHAVDARRSLASQWACTEVAQSVVDLEARYLPAQEVEVVRFHLLTQRLRVAAADVSGPRLLGGVASLEWIRDRLDLRPEDAIGIDAALAQLRGAADSGAFASAADIATRLATAVRDAHVGGR